MVGRLARCRRADRGRFARWRCEHAKGGTRTPTAFRLPAPKTGASASSATFARVHFTRAAARRARTVYVRYASAKRKDTTGESLRSLSGRGLRAGKRLASLAVGQRAARRVAFAPLSGRGLRAGKRLASLAVGQRATFGESLRSLSGRGLRAGKRLASLAVGQRAARKSRFRSLSGRGVRGRDSLRSLSGRELLAESLSLRVGQRAEGREETRFARCRAKGCSKSRFRSLSGRGLRAGRDSLRSLSGTGLFGASLRSLSGHRAATPLPSLARRARGRDARRIRNAG